MTQTIHVSQKYTSVDFIMAMKQNAVYISENMLIYLMDQHKNGMNDKIVFFFSSSFISLNQFGKNYKWMI